MKKFKSYITEVARQSSLSTMLFDLSRHSVDDMKIPLGSSIIERLWPDKIRSKAFHLTDDVIQIKKMQKSKKSISAFFYMDSYFLENGIQTEGGYVVELTGDILVAGPDDLNTEVDKSGRRYVSFQTLRQGSDDGGLGGGAKLGGMKRDLHKMIKDLVDVYEEWIESEDIEVALGKKIELNGFDKAMKDFKKNPFRAWRVIGDKIRKSRGSGFSFSMAIKDYLDGVEKIMKKHSKVLQSLFYNYAKNRIFRYERGKYQSEWDEIVVNNFVVDKIHISPAHSEFHKDEETFIGFPITVWNDIKKLEKYIQKTTKIKK